MHRESRGVHGPQGPLARRQRLRLHSGPRRTAAAAMPASPGAPPSPRSTGSTGLRFAALRSGLCSPFPLTMSGGVPLVLTHAGERDRTDREPGSSDQPCHTRPFAQRHYRRGELGRPVGPLFSRTVDQPPRVVVTHAQRGARQQTLHCPHGRRPRHVPLVSHSYHCVLTGCCVRGLGDAGLAKLETLRLGSVAPAVALCIKTSTRAGVGGGRPSTLRLALSASVTLIARAQSPWSLFPVRRSTRGVDLTPAGTTT